MEAKSTTSIVENGATTLALHRDRDSDTTSVWTRHDPFKWFFVGVLRDEDRRLDPTLPFDPTRAFELRQWGDIADALEEAFDIYAAGLPG